MIFMSQGGITKPAQQAAWDHWYRARLESLYAERARDPATIQITPKTHLYFTANTARPLAGTPRKIVEDLLAYEDQGVEEFIFYVPVASESEKLDNLQRIAEDIMPQVAK